ncbi:hypothetical protein [Hyphomicrobium sp. DY-1]|uniref:hypothetical protein n=1 Tax=Hyphomicrobium sp. DY-1 TaxID=3075650 RepID=UPI0039C194EB
MEFLVACDRVVLSGGLIRFDRIARTISDYGHSLSFVAFGSKDCDRPTDLEVLDIGEAQARRWDGVMIPGAGFPAETIERFRILQNPNFGTRIQFILNDQTRRLALLP